MQNEDRSVEPSFRVLRPHFVIPITERHYIVIRQVSRPREVQPGIYGTTDCWLSSYFYISDLGVNCWVSLPRFVYGVRRWRKEKELGTPLLEALIPEPRPETAIWIETRTRAGGLLFKPYLFYGRTTRRV